MNFLICHNQRQPPKCFYIKHSGGFSTFKISLFHIKIQSKIHICSDTSFWSSFFKILGRLGTKKWILGTAWRPAESKNGDQNRPFLKDGDICLKNVTDISPTRLRGRLRSAPGHHFGWFGDGILKNVKGFVHHFPSHSFLFIDLSSILNRCWLHL